MNERPQFIHHLLYKWTATCDFFGGISLGITDEFGTFSRSTVGKLFLLIVLAYFSATHSYTQHERGEFPDYTGSCFSNTPLQRVRSVKVIKAC